MRCGQLVTALISSPDNKNCKVRSRWRRLRHGPFHGGGGVKRPWLWFRVAVSPGNNGPGAHATLIESQCVGLIDIRPLIGMPANDVDGVSQQRGAVAIEALWRRLSPPGAPTLRCR
jgi:hypothetical protein